MAQPELRPDVRESPWKHHQRGFCTRFCGYIRSQFGWPDALRLRGSVMLPTLPGVIFMSLFSALVVHLHVRYEVAMNIPMVVLSTVSVALGLLLAFRVNTAYDRYWEARKLIQTVIATIRNLARQIWINVPEETEQDYLEKMRCVKLLLAFMVATKHHLRQEYGIQYEDLKVLLPPDWKPCSVAQKWSMGTGEQRFMPCEMRPENDKRRRICTLCNDPTNPTLAVCVHDSVKPVGNKGPLESDVHNDICNVRRSQVQKYCPEWQVGYAPTTAIRQQALEDETMPIVTSRLTVSTYSSCTPEPDTCLHEASPLWAGDGGLLNHGDGDLSLPLEILFRITLYVHQAKAAGKIEAPFVSVMTSSLDVLANTLTAFERIVHTPIPKAYNIHLKQGVILYVLFLPFALVETLNWMVVPIVSLIAFTLFGIEAIGNEIENPFGYDPNDLPLNHYCEELKKEVEFIIYRIPTQ